MQQRRKTESGLIPSPSGLLSGFSPWSALSNVTTGKVARCFEVNLGIRCHKITMPRHRVGIKASPNAASHHAEEPDLEYARTGRWSNWLHVQSWLRGRPISSSDSIGFSLCHGMLDPLIPAARTLPWQAAAHMCILSGSEQCAFCCAHVPSDEHPSQGRMRNF